LLRRSSVVVEFAVNCFCNVMGHTQKPDFVFRRNGRVHLNQQGRQFSRLLAAKVRASAVVTLNTPRFEVVKGTGYPLHSPVSPSLPLPCVTMCHHVSTGLYQYKCHCVLQMKLRTCTEIFHACTTIYLRCWYMEEKKSVTNTLTLTFTDR
jgi:hypothetical protein